MGNEILPGKTYALTSAGMVEANGKKPTVWACRRVEDFPEGVIATLHNPGFAICESCAAPIVYNTARTVQAPKVCMQCMGIEPEPYR